MVDIESKIISYREDTDDYRLCLTREEIDEIKDCRANVIDEFLKKDKECQQNNNECPYMYSDISCVECIAKKLKEQK